MTAIIATFFARIGDLEAVKGVVDPDATFVGVRAGTYPNLPLYGTFVGHNGLERFLAGLTASFEPQQFVIDDQLETETVGFASGRFEHRLRASNRLLRGHWAVRCHFRDGKITRYRFYEDTAALEEAFDVHTHSREDIADVGP